MRIPICVIAAVGMSCAHTSPSVRVGHALIADYAYDGTTVRALVAVEGVIVDAQVSARAAVEVRHVRECGSRRHLPHVVTVTEAPNTGAPEFFELPPGVYWGRYLEALIFLNPGPACILAELGFPTYDPGTRELQFIEAEVELRKN